MHVGHGFVVFASVQFLLNLLEHADGAVGLFAGVCCGGDDSEHNLALRYHGVNHNGAENAVILTQVYDHVGALVHIAREENRCDGRLGDTGVEALGLE